MTPSQRKDIAAFMMESAKKKKKLPFGKTKGAPSKPPFPPMKGKS